MFVFVLFSSCFKNVYMKLTEEKSVPKHVYGTADFSPNVQEKLRKILCNILLFVYIYVCVCVCL